MKKRHSQIENHPQIRHSNERIRVVHLKTIEEHSSGVNQLLKINQKNEMVTVSDDCYLKFWSQMKVEASIATETITCITITGSMSSQKTQDVLVAGCHSGNLLIINANTKVKKEQIQNAHYNLIRVLCSLNALNHRYFVSADVCGVLKVWTSTMKPSQCLELDLEQAISYNSLVEVTGYLPKGRYDDAALVACALKSLRVLILMLFPSASKHQILMTLQTEQKPTCLIQLSSRHLAVAVGSLKEPSVIEVHQLQNQKIVSRLSYHQDMIDSLLKLTLPVQKTKTQSPYIQWLLSASRDRQIVIWKLIDGKVMRRVQVTNNGNISQRKASHSITSSIMGGLPPINQSARIAQIDTNNGIQQKTRKNPPRQKKPSGPGEDEDDEEDSLLNDDQYYDPNNNNEVIEEESKNMFISQRQASSSMKGASVRMQAKQQTSTLQDHFYALDSGHKDFIRSMVQMSDHSIITASEDKTIKIFQIGY